VNSYNGEFDIKRSRVTLFEEEVYFPKIQVVFITFWQASRRNLGNNVHGKKGPWKKKSTVKWPR